MTVKRVGTYRALDCVFELRTHSALADPLESALVDLRCDDAPDDRLVVRYRRRSGWECRWHRAGRDHSHGETVREEGDALQDALAHISAAAARSASAHDAVLHGGAVAIDGHAVALVGHDGSGTAVLAATAVLDGHLHVSNDVAAIDPNGRVRCFARPVGLKPEEADGLGVEIPPGPFDTVFPFRIAPTSHGENLMPLRAVFLVQTSDVDRCERIDPADALVELYRNSVGAEGSERRMFARLETVVRTVPVHRLEWQSHRAGIEQIRTTLS
ncbi:MAG: hypothetical protein ABJH68_08145 [Ilumatobacter sp.]|uniref:hypothetical protein n=1 Tax=Ilumatobacter sp. TaxID=1967498 RepID=UPI003297F04F